MSCHPLRGTERYDDDDEDVETRARSFFARARPSAPLYFLQKDKIYKYKHRDIMNYGLNFFFHFFFQWYRMRKSTLLYSLD